MRFEDCGIVGQLLEALQGKIVAVFHDADPRAGHVDVAKTSNVAVLHTFYI